ncbi:TetR/AcrR family transcriptional regulator [Paenibacillus sp. R14(2021)]|uniref:TetR/AcrR family transcriptional regulator n=1 Tax=Paenibacillus sp. R14(2021) TaxID=2859228 RepID=UPI0021581210|nr:TetR/AcrR family transcriptional regulator [Paenibacillus sp. R14(2021)]
MSYDDLSKKLGITKASIHYYFEKKEDLGVAITERVQQSLQSFFLHINNAALTVEEKMKQFMEKQIMMSGNGICPISSLQSDFVSLPEVIQHKVEEASKLELKILVSIFSEKCPKGSSMLQSPQDIELLAYTILSCIKGALQYKRTLSRDVLAQVMEQIICLVKFKFNCSSELTNGFA